MHEVLTLDVYPHCAKGWGHRHIYSEAISGEAFLDFSARLSPRGSFVSGEQAAEGGLLHDKENRGLACLLSADYGTKHLSWRTF